MKVIWVYEWFKEVILLLLMCIAFNKTIMKNVNYMNVTLYKIFNQ